jgi:general secretion pathway protein J
MSDRIGKPNRRGFTLVELLVAISILAVVAVLGWRGLDTIVRARTALTAQMETTRGMQLAFAQMQSDCEHKAGRDIIDNRPWMLAEPGRLTLVRETFAENQPSRLQVVSYRLVNGVLLRRESAPTRDLLQLDGLWQAATSDADTSPAVALQAGVTDMQISIWQNNIWRQAGTDPGANAAGAATSLAPAPPQQNNALQQLQQQQQQNSAPTGLMVALRAQALAAPLVKSFLLGEP